MMQLRGALASPFVRKVRITARPLGLDGKIGFVPADLTNPDDPLTRQNPLGKLPALILEDETALFDSRVILEYLDHLAGGGKLIPAGDGRWAILRLAALADGIIDAAILRVYEGRYRPGEKHHQPWLDYQLGKTERALAELEAAPPAWSGAPDMGTISLACALGYLDFRFPGS